MKQYGIMLCIAVMYLIPVSVKAQCSGGTAIAGITPTTSFQTITIQGGQYTTFTAIAAGRYLFSFCQGGGSVSFDSQITLINSGLTAVGYNDDACGTGSQILFIAPAAGTYRVLVNVWNCAANTTNATLAYKTIVYDEPCSAYFMPIKCSAAAYETFNNTPATNSSLAAPACAAGLSYTGGDLWFSTQVPYTGNVTVTTNVGTNTDMAMAVYRGNTSCTSMVSLACDDNTGPGSMPEIALTGLNPGDTIFVRVWDKNNNDLGTFTLKIYDPSPNYCMNGSAKQIFPTRCIEMTPNQTGQSSSLWNSTQLNLASAFDYNFDMNFGSNDGTGADGITFTFHNNAAGLAAVGSSGSALGVGGIANSVSIEFDTFQNGGASEIAADHTAIFFNGVTTSPVTTPIQASSTSTNIEDGVYHNARITWNPGTMTLSVYFDGVFRTSYTGDIVNTVLGGSTMAYWGFTSSTGTYTNQQIACPNNLPGAPMPVQWTNYHLILNDQQVANLWSTANESNTDVFIIERSLNGTDFTAIGSIAAAGNSSSQKDYKFVDFEPANGISYYRLKQIDNDGKFTFSPIRSVQLGNDGSSHMRIYPNPTHASKTISIEYFNINSGFSSLIIYDQIGREVLRSEVVNGTNQINLPENLITGIYQIIIRSDNDVAIQKLSVE